MLSKETETYVVVIGCTPTKNGYYKIELGDAEGEIYQLSIHEETVLDYRLVVGKALDKKTFETLQNSTDYQKAYSYAIGILARRMYTEKEIRRKLYAREMADDVIDAVITKLFEIDVLNDVSYARIYIESQTEMGKKSRRRIISDLSAKGICATIIDDLTDLFNNESESTLIEEEIKRMHQRYSRKNLSDFDLRNKVSQALGRKGFDFYEVQRQYDFFIQDLEGNDAEGDISLS